MRASALMALAAVAAAGAFSTAPAGGSEPTLSQAQRDALSKQGQKPTPTQSTSMRALLGGGIGGRGSSWRRAKPGWSNRHVQRMAAKKRNQARHKRACK